MSERQICAGRCFTTLEVTVRVSGSAFPPWRSWLPPAAVAVHHQRSCGWRESSWTNWTGICTPPQLWTSCTSYVSHTSPRRTWSTFSKIILPSLPSVIFSVALVIVVKWLPSGNMSDQWHLVVEGHPCPSSLFGFYRFSFPSILLLLLKGTMFLSHSSMRWCCRVVLGFWTPCWDSTALSISPSSHADSTAAWPTTLSYRYAHSRLAPSGGYLHLCSKVNGDRVASYSVFFFLNVTQPIPFWGFDLSLSLMWFCSSEDPCWPWPSSPWSWRPAVLTGWPSPSTCWGRHRYMTDCPHKTTSGQSEALSTQYGFVAKDKNRNCVLRSSRKIRPRGNSQQINSSFILKKDSPPSSKDNQRKENIPCQRFWTWCSDFLFIVFSSC